MRFREISLGGTHEAVVLPRGRSESYAKACISGVVSCAVAVLKAIVEWAEYSELAIVFFFQAMALGMWLVPLSHILDAHGLAELRPYAYATSAVAAFVSPLIFGAMADRHASPVLVLRGLAAASAAAIALAASAIKLSWNPWLVLALIQLHALCSSPTWSISCTIVFSRLRDSKREFGR